MLDTCCVLHMHRLASYIRSICKTFNIHLYVCKIKMYRDSQVS